MTSRPIKLAASLAALTTTFIAAFAVAQSRQAASAANPAGVYAITRTVTSSTCPGIAVGEVSANVYVVSTSDASSARERQFTLAVAVLGTTNYPELTGASDGRQINLTGEAGQTRLTAELQLAGGRVTGTETVNAVVERRACSVVRSVAGRRLER